jgi:hypothetical protein
MKPLKLTPTGAHLPEGFDHKRDGCQPDNATATDRKATPQHRRN